VANRCHHDAGGFGASFEIRCSGRRHAGQNFVILSACDEIRERTATAADDFPSGLRKRDAGDVDLRSGAESVRGWLRRAQELESVRVLA